jgi:phosphatidylglycerol:prolipoprotein diacylglycerol transferase
VHPVLFRIGDFTVTSFGAMLAAAFLVAGHLTQMELRRYGREGDEAWQLMLGAVVGGILGAKLYYAFLNWPDLVRDPWGTLLSRAGLVWYGGFLGGTLGVVLLVRRWRLPLGTIADAVAVALPAAYAVGRIGCFLVGDDYGRPTDAWVGIAFPQGAPPSTAGNLRRLFGVNVDPAIPDDRVLAVHPTQLYEVAMSLAIFAVLWRIRTRPRPAGALFLLYLVLAGTERFVVEFLRAKDDRFLEPFTLAQLLSAALVVGALLGLRRLRRTASPRPQAA